MGALVGCIERGHFQRMHACEDALIASVVPRSHVHVGVVGGDVPARCHGVGEHFAGATAPCRRLRCWPTYVRHELGHLHEVIGADRHREADGPGSLFGAQPCFRQFTRYSCPAASVKANSCVMVEPLFWNVSPETVTNFAQGPPWPPDEPGDGLVTLLSVVAVAERAPVSKAAG